jgi:hypothetical protein
MPFPILGTPKPAFFDSSGSPLVSGTLTIKDPTADTNKATYPTYDDAVAATNANDNPITLDSRGETTTELWGLDGEDYKLVLADSAAANVWTVDDVFMPGNNYTVKTGATEAQIQAAIDAAEATNGHVWFEPGTYTGNWTITAALTIHATDGVILTGSSAAAVVTCTGDFVNVVGGLKIDGASTSIYCWHHEGSNNCNLDSLWLTGATSHGLYIQGIVGDGAYYNSFHNLVSKTNGGAGVKLEGTATPDHRANVNNFFGGQVSSNTGAGFDIDTVAGTAIFGTAIETNTGYALKFTDCTKAALTMIGGWIESNTAGGVNIDATTLMVQMYGTRFNQATEFSGAGISNTGNVFMVDSISGVLTKWMETVGGAFRDCHLRTALSDQLQTVGQTTLQARVTGDTEWRYQLANNGNQFFGTGALASDINFGRGAGGESILSSKEWAATTGVRVGGVSGPIWTSGSGTPESNLAGSPGDLYSDTDGGAGVTLYVKESGAATTTGWIAK